jgi:hypothetical protein
LEEVTVHAGHKVLMEATNNISLVVGDPQGILDLQLKPYPMYLLDIITIIIIFIN